jgi:hypothetical protein
MASELEKNTETVISVDEYRSLVNDFDSSEDKIIQRINYLTAFCRNIARAELDRYVNKIKNYE